MKKNKFVFLLFLFFINTSVSFSQINDSLSVSISQADSLFDIDLIFDNISSDTMIVSGKYRNISFEWESGVGIGINTFCNGKFFRLTNYGDMQDLQFFIFSKQKFLLIPSKTKVKFRINLQRYLGVIEKKYDYGVSLDINYIYARMNKQSKLPKMIRLTTNYIELKNSLSTSPDK